MPLVESPATPAPECAALRLTAGNDASEPVLMSNADQRVVELEMANMKLENRVADLELALAEARRIIRDRENLLTEVQFKPKDDFYAWKNPKFTEKQVKDEMETRLHGLLDQMRVMEKVLSDREREIEFMTAQLQEINPDFNMDSPSFHSPIGSPAVRSPLHNVTAAASPKFSFPVKSPAQGPSWSRSPMASPMTSPQQPKKWWVFGSSTLSDSNSKVQATMVDVL